MLHFNDLLALLSKGDYVAFAEMQNRRRIIKPVQQISNVSYAVIFAHITYNTKLG